ncbi:hypothetical protein [Burkholderia sp. Ac-20365]|uniref:hypothetical protein n=1 Tax=Burkholderia sp. Ac-20365 TaxID=2703897 RepID=UPI00197C7381|nr:hypothetical protein [Burkholderia sp. Ac-20365]MBN3761186.1 hypothetical protein [Burkholderia sp. Ac-20365]
MQKATGSSMQITRPLRAAETGLLSIVLANVVETQQAGDVPLSVFCVGDVRQWFPSQSAKRILDLLESIAQVQWWMDASEASSDPKPIFRRVIEKGAAFVVEVDRRYIAQREAEKVDSRHHLPEMLGLTESVAIEALAKRGLAVRILLRDGQRTSPFQTADIRRDRANLNVELGQVVAAFIG